MHGLQAQDNFRRWFAGSAIVDAAGQPLVQFHASRGARVDADRDAHRRSGWARAELERMALRHGIDRARWADVAQTFARWIADGDRAQREGVTGQVLAHARQLLRQAQPAPEGALGFACFEMPAGETELGAHFGTAEQASSFGRPHAFYLAIRNPLRLPDLGTWHYQSVMREARRRGVPISESEYDRVFNAPFGNANAALRELLLAKGVDGIVYRNEVEGTGDSFIALRPNQIKSARGNSGAFDPDCDDAFDGAQETAQVDQMRPELETIGEGRGEAEGCDRPRG